MFSLCKEVLAMFCTPASGWVSGIGHLEGGGYCDVDVYMWDRHMMIYYTRYILSGYYAYFTGGEAHFLRTLSCR